MAEAEIQEDFPKDFAIYDLTQFLRGVFLHNQPELDFANDGHVVIREGKTRSKYFFADPSVIVVPPEKSLTLPTMDVEFELAAEQLEKIRKAVLAFQLPDLSVIGEAGVVKLVVHDKKNDTSNDFQVLVGETDGEFCFHFKVENIKVIPGDYKVSISSKLLSKFVNTDYDLTYYIALEPDSNF